MNLIEQLGGYEKAKEWHDENTDKEWVGIYHMPKLYLALLEYRRQHNIFEVGDKIVYLPNIAPEHNDIYDVWKVDLICCLAMLGDMDYRAMYDQIRHATNEEIKSGRRL